VSLDLSCRPDVVFRAKHVPRERCIAEIGSLPSRRNYFHKNPYNRVCGLKNNSTLEQLNVWRSRVTSCCGCTKQNLPRTLPVVQQNLRVAM